MRRRFWTFFHSIKGRLVALFLLLALGTTAIFLGGSQRWLQSGWQSLARPLLQDYAERLAAEIGSPPDPARALALAQRLPIAVRIEGPERISGTPYETHPGRFDDDRRHRRRAEDYEAPWLISVARADGHRIRFALAAPADFDRPRWIGWITLGALLLLTGVAYAAVRRQLKPLQQISAGVEAFGRGDFTRPIAVRRDDELGLLARRVNGMAHNLHGMLDAKRALLLAMSHELRSPLTRARINAELLDDSPERSALLRDLAEMAELITSLLEGERLAAGHSALATEAVDLAALAADVVAAEARSLADGAMAAELRLQPVGEPVVADALRLRLVLRNLLQNARRHGGGAADAGPAAGKPPQVFLRREADGRRALGVRDFGPGIVPELLPQLGQAFWRPDSARTRAGGGVGLGLYLCRLVAQAHGGELVIRNAQPGLEVAMVW